MSNKLKKVCGTINYIEHFFILASTVTWCILTSAFTSIVDFLVGVTSFAIGLEICSIAAGIKKYKSIIN